MDVSKVYAHAQNLLLTHTGFNTRQIETNRIGVRKLGDASTSEKILSDINLVV